MDTLLPTKPDQLHKSLSAAWGSFLGAQQCSREVSALRRTLDEHIQATSLSIASLQRDAARQHELATTAAAESKSRIEQQVSDSKEIVALRDGLASVQQEIRQSREHASRRIAELSERVGAHRESLEDMKSVLSRDVSTVQEQYRSALEKLELLQGELRELKAEKVVAEQRLAVLECQITAMAQARQEQLSEEMVRFLDQVFSRREELMLSLDKRDCDAPTQTQTQTATQASLCGTLRGEPLSQNEGSNTSGGTQRKQPNTQTAKKTEMPPANTQATKHPIPSDGQDIRTLYLSFRERYKKTPPKSDVAFVWEFIDCIESPAMSRHIQESLTVMLPDFVTRRRDTRRKNPNRHVHISRNITWRTFREALAKIPPPG